MDDQYRAVEVKGQELLASLEPLFGEDTATAAALLIAPFYRKVPEAEREQVLAALNSLPKGSRAWPTVIRNTLRDGRWGFFLVYEDFRFHGVKTFDTRADADAYGSEFLLRLREIGVAGPLLPG